MAANEINEDLENLKRDIQQLRSDVASMAKSLKSLTAATGEEAYQRAEALGQAARRRAAAMEEQLGQEINERPLTSVLAAFGIGFLIGKILDGRG